MNPEKFCKRSVYDKTSFSDLALLDLYDLSRGSRNKRAVSGLLLWYSSVVPALFPFMVLSSVLSASGGVQALMRPFPVIFRFAGLSADGWYVLLTGLLCGCPMGSKDICRSLRGRADQLRGGEISLCTLQSSKSHVSRRFRLSHVCFPGPVVIFCLFYLRTSTPSRGPGQPDLPGENTPGPPFRPASPQRHRRSIPRSLSTPRS